MSWRSHNSRSLHAQTTPVTRLSAGQSHCWLYLGGVLRVPRLGWNIKPSHPPGQVQLKYDHHWEMGQRGDNNILILDWEDFFLLLNGYGYICFVLSVNNEDNETNLTCPTSGLTFHSKPAIRGWSEKSELAVKEGVSGCWPLPPLWWVEWTVM